MHQFPEELTTPMIGAAVTMLVLVWLIFHRAAKKLMFSFIFGIILSLWLVSVLLFSRDGFFLKLSLPPFPNIALMFVPIIVGVATLARVVTFQKAVDTIFQPWLIGVQTMRVMGAAFLTLYARGLMPFEFAIPAGIGDIVIGSTAPFVALVLFFNHSWGRAVAIVWNGIGFLELTVSIILGFFTSLTPYQLLALNNPNELLFNFPLALVPLFAVPLSLLLHIFSLRVLFKSA